MMVDLAVGFLAGATVASVTWALIMVPILDRQREELVKLHSELQVLQVRLKRVLSGREKANEREH